MHYSILTSIHWVIPNIFNEVVCIDKITIVKKVLIIYRLIITGYFVCFVLLDFYVDAEFKVRIA